MGRSDTNLKERPPAEYIDELRSFIAACEKEEGLSTYDARKRLASGSLKETDKVSRWMYADAVLAWLSARNGHGKH